MEWGSLSVPLRGYYPEQLLPILSNFDEALASVRNHRYSFEDGFNMLQTRPRRHFYISLSYEYHLPFTISICFKRRRRRRASVFQRLSVSVPSLAPSADSPGDSGRPPSRPPSYSDNAAFGLRIWKQSCGHSLPPMGGGRDGQWPHKSH